MNDDLISRDAVLDACSQSINILDAMSRIEDLPSVTPKQRTGHNCNDDYADCDQFICSECGIELQDWHRIERDEDDGEETRHDFVMRYRPNCGAKMEEQA